MNEIIDAIKQCLIKLQDRGEDVSGAMEAIEAIERYRDYRVLPTPRWVKDLRGERSER